MQWFWKPGAFIIHLSVTQPLIDTMRQFIRLQAAGATNCFIQRFFTHVQNYSPKTRQHTLMCEIGGVAL